MVRPIQKFARTRAEAEHELANELMGKPVGTSYQLYESSEVLIVGGVVETK